MWIFLWDTEPSKIFVWWSEVASVWAGDIKVRPPYVPRTFTISWNESNLSSWWTYSDDATWLTAWDTAFDEFFWYYGCRLNWSKTETAKITQAWSGWAWKLDITQLWTLTSWDNVMIAFPVRWIKMSKSWSVVTLSVTEELEKTGYQYYAHSTWTLSNPWTPNWVMYLWAYKGFSSSGVLKSRSWQTITASQTQATACTQAKANGSWYNIMGFYQREYINALYMMKYGNPNSQWVVWMWNVASSWPSHTWWTNNQDNATYWTSSNTQQVKLFWLEDWWGNIHEWVWWVYATRSTWNKYRKQLNLMLNWWSWDISWGELEWTEVYTTNGDCLSNIVGSNKLMFSPIWTANDYNYNSGYRDQVSLWENALAYAWWYWTRLNFNGAFRLNISAWTTTASNEIASRLMCL